MTIAEALRLYESGNAHAARSVCLSIIEDRADARAEQLLGRIYQDLGDVKKAIDHWQRAFELDSKIQDLGWQLALLLIQGGDNDSARVVLRKYLTFYPDSAQAHQQLGQVLERLGRPGPAIHAYREAVRLLPSNSQSYLFLGRALKKVGRADRAIAAFRNAIALQRDLKSAWHSLAATYAERGSVEMAIQTERELLKLPDPSDASYSNLLYKLYYLPSLSAQQILNESLSWGERLMTHAGEPQPHSNERSAEKRLRVGYLSPDFRDHPVARLLEPVIASHNRNGFEVFCYSNLHPSGDEVTKRFKQMDVQWRDVADHSDDQLATLIRSDQIDLLIEAAGHFGGNRLPALASRPAPIQINAFGWCGTTGLRAIDYRLTDSLSDPPGMTDANYSEALVRLPNCTWVYRPFDSAMEVGPVPALANGFITFGNLNNPVKTSPDIAREWAQILKQVPGSRLRLLCTRGAETLTLKRFADLGIPSSRLELVSNCDRHRYMGLFNGIDIALDPFPFNGDNCTCDALWMGVPVISLAGDAYHSRRGLSHLTSVGLNDLAVFQGEDYVKAAVTLARNLPRLQSLRVTLRERLKTSPLGEASAFCQELERTYRRLWTSWCSRA